MFLIVWFLHYYLLPKENNNENEHLKRVKRKMLYRKQFKCHQGIYVILSDLLINKYNS